jgi:pyruvate dehydrogenase E1 component alpha subunit
MHLVAPEAGLLGSPIIMGSSVPLAIGAALAAQLRSSRQVVVSFFGEGVTNEGCLYESLNFAALKKLPVVFVCENNGFATHLRVTDCLADTRVDNKAQSLGVPASRIDGNDVIDVFDAAGDAIARARRGDGPTLLECLTFRWRGHVGPKEDIGPRLRSQSELDEWKARCPIIRLERVLREAGVDADAHRRLISEAADAEIGDAFAFARQSEYPDSSEMPDMLFRQERANS